MHTPTDSPSDDTQQDQVEDQVVTGSSTPDANAAAGTSDAVEGANQAELSLEDVIKASLAKPNEAAADTPADSKGSEETGSEDATEAKADDKSDADKEADEDAKVPFHKHPRWQKKLEVERELRTKVSGYEAEIEPLRGKAEQLDQIGRFMVTNSLTPEEMSEGMEIMAMMKNDPAKALAALMPKLEQLEIATGKRFPQDIQERLDAGSIDAEAAAELTQTRFAAKVNEARAEVATQTVEQRNATDLHNGMRTAVQTWEADLKTRDPDYSHKQSFVIDRTRVLAAATPPKTPEDAVALAKQAYEDVNKNFARIVPKKEAVVPSVRSDKSSIRSAAQPTSLLDIVRQHTAR